MVSILRIHLLDGSEIVLQFPQVVRQIVVGGLVVFPSEVVPTPLSDEVQIETIPWFARRTKTVLHKMGIVTVGDLREARPSRVDVGRMKNAGQRTVDQVVQLAELCDFPLTQGDYRDPWRFPRM